MGNVLLIKNNLYGIVEKTSPYETLQVALAQNPEIEKVYIILDESVSGKLAQEDISTELSIFNNVELNFMNDLSFEQILKTIRHADKNAIIFYGFYVVDVDGGVHTLDYTTSKVSHTSPVPVYGLLGF